MYIYIYGIETFNVQTIIITRKPMFLFAQEDILVGHWCLPLTEVWSFVDFSAHTATIAGTWACCQMWHHPSRCEARELDAIWPQTLGLIHFRGNRCYWETALEKLLWFLLGTRINLEFLNLKNPRFKRSRLFLCSCYPQVAHAMDLDKALKRSVFT